MYALTHIEDILNFVVSYMSNVSADSLFMLDNMYLQLVQWMLKFLKEVEITQFELLTHIGQARQMLLGEFLLLQ